MLRTPTCGIVPAFLALAGPAQAHHSFAMFDPQRSLTLQGTVREFQWTNPHCFIQLLVQTPDGPVEWSLEMNSPGASMREGWRRNMLNAGDQITVVIHPVRDGTPGGQVLKVTDQRGNPIPDRRVTP